MRILSIVIPVTIAATVLLISINEWQKNKVRPEEKVKESILSPAKIEPKKFKPRKTIASIRWTKEGEEPQGSHSVVKLSKGLRIETKHTEQQTRQAQLEQLLFKEKSVICRWTAGKMGKLMNTIESGRKGKESIFCEEYNKRKKELHQYDCDNRSNLELMKFC